MGNGGATESDRWRRLVDGDEPPHWPAYLSYRSVGCWCWLVALTVLLGIFSSVAWWWATTLLLAVATVALWQNPQDR